MGMCADGNCPECVAEREKDALMRSLRPDLTDEQRTELGVRPPSSLSGWHDAFKRRSRMARIRSGGTIRKPDTGEPKGKAAIKAAKRARVKAMKSANEVSA